MKIFKNKLFVSLLSVVSALVLVLGITFSCIDFSSENRDQSTFVGADGPVNTDGYWIDEGRYGTTEWSGAGTEENPYLIQSAQDLARLSYMVYSGNGPYTTSSIYNLFYSDLYFKQTADIDLSAYYWQPIGINYDRSGKTQYRYFSGNYDGDGRVVSGVFTRAGSTDAYRDQGLFGCVSYSNISNIGVVNSLIQGWAVGGVVSKVGRNGVITNCYNAGTIIEFSRDGYIGSVGGVVGSIDRATITNCYNIGTITAEGSNYVGGIVGTVSGATITNCYNTGTISGNAYVGGIIGDLKSSSSTARNGEVTNCYNIGIVKGTNYVGGIVARVNNMVVRNCYNTGSVTGTGTNVGGIGGSSNTQIRKCYYGGECELTQGVKGSSSGTDSTTKITDLNTTTYSKSKDWYTNSSNWDASYPWDFDNVWTIVSGINDGYPIFKNQFPIYWTDIDTYNPEGQQPNSSAPDGYGWAYFDLTIVDTAGRYSTTYTNLTNEPTGHIELGYGSIMTISNIRPMNSIHAFGSITAGNGITDNRNGTYTYTVTSADDVIKINLIYADSEAPVIHRSTYVTREDGYDVYAYVTDNMNVNRVQFPTWTEYNGQDDIQVEWWQSTNTTARGTQGSYTIDGQTYNYKYAVNMSDHNNEIGLYHTHIYAYDDAGNEAGNSSGNVGGWCILDIYFARPWTDLAATSFAGGNGTQSSPYEIATPEQLALLTKQSKTSSLTGLYYKLTASIDLENKATKNSQYVWYVWDGIGNNDFGFAGDFNGGFYTLNNLQSKINSSAGLFVIIKGGNVSNVIISNSSIVGLDGVGAIVGHLDAGVVQKCIIRDTSISNRSNNYEHGHVGGIAGTISNGRIENCIVKDVEIKSDQWEVGGIAGSYYGGEIKNCSLFNATMTARERLGLFFGYGSQNNAQASYGCGTVDGTETKLMYGNSSAWGDWVYNTSINNGYPIQKSLCWLGEFAPSNSSGIYSQLKNTLKFTEIT